MREHDRFTALDEPADGQTPTPLREPGKAA